MRKDLTIIIPHFNSSGSLEKLLSTIPHNESIQIIVVDDKSEKKHIKYIKGLKENYDFEFYLNNKIKSAGSCRNIGLTYAKGKWVIFADADDYFTDSFYSIVSEYFNSNNDVVFFVPTSIYLDTGEEAERHTSYKNILENYISTQSISSELKVRYNIYTPWSKMIKQRFIVENNIKFDEVMVSNDVMFSIKTGYHMKNFSVYSNIIYVITRSHETLTTTINEEFFDIRLGVFVDRYNYLRDVLQEEEFSALNMNGLIRVYESKKFGLLKMMKTYIKFYKSDVKLFDTRLVNPIFIIKKFYINEENK